MKRITNAVAAFVEAREELRHADADLPRVFVFTGEDLEADEGDES